MASNLLTADEYETLFRRWKSQHGELGKAFNGKQRHQVPANSDARYEMYRILVNNLITKHGYSEDDLRGKSCFDRIVNTSVPLKYNNKKALKNWIEFATIDLNEAIDSFFEEVVPEAPVGSERVKKSTKVAAPYERIRPADISPDTPMIDRSKLRGPAPVSVIDESIDLVAELYGDENE